MKKQQFRVAIWMGLMLLILTACSLPSVVTEHLEERQGVLDELRKVQEVKLYKLINAQGISVKIGDNVVLQDDTGRDLYMNENMALLVRADLISQMLQLQTSMMMNETCRLTWHDRQMQCSTYPSDDPRGVPYLSLQEVMEGLYGSYEFNVQERSAVISLEPEIKVYPEYYSLLDEGRMTQVRSQGTLGTCWAFAANAAMESTLTPEEYLNFSADHMSMNSGFQTDQYTGGDFFISLAYLASWKGPVLEEDDPYGDGYTDISLKAVKHLQEAVKINEKDYDRIKEMIMTYGAVQSSFYSDIVYKNEGTTYYNIYNANYYYNGEENANHDVVIVGWDDYYPKEYFNIQPASDGAFICQNSWGADFANDGYFYISYEDTNIGAYNMCYTRLEPADNYDHIYQSDATGWVGSVGFEQDEAWAANVYHAKSPQQLKAVSFYATDANTYYSIYVVPKYKDEGDFFRADYVGSGYVPELGYYTVEVPEAWSVSGDYAVVAKLVTEGTQHPIAIEYVIEEADTEIDLTDGHGYLSYEGTVWQSAEELYECNICLKAFTDDFK